FDANSDSEIYCISLHDALPILAMGLLSFMPVEKKDIKLLQQTIQAYHSNPNWYLYLWKEADDIVGAIGLRIADELNVVVQHISRSEEHTSELQSRFDLVCRLLL